MDEAQIVRLRRSAGLLFMSGMGPEEAVLEAKGRIDARSGLVMSMSEVMIDSQPRTTDGKAPQHVEDAVDAIRNTVNAINTLPRPGAKTADGHDAALVEAWLQRRWHGSRDVCSACGNPFEGKSPPTGKMGPFYHPGCREQAERRIAFTFARLVVAKVRERDGAD